MSDQKEGVSLKNILNQLSQSQVFGIGLVGGVLVLCTIGFFIFIGLALSNDNPVKLPNKASEVVKDVPSQQNKVQPPKSDKPEVELFVMSHCPYGLQMEKAYLPAWELLGGVANMDVKFVNYAMHGQKELEEENRQYCIQKEQGNKYIAYLKCFTAADNPSGCMASAGVNTSKVDSCVAGLEKQFGTMAKYADKSTWLSGRYPVYPVYDNLNKKYGVKGSPTLIITGKEVSPGRAPEAIKQAICAAFNNPPKECETTLSSSVTSPSFGTAVGGNDADSAGCGA